MKEGRGEERREEKRKWTKGGRRGKRIRRGAKR